jgi:hypothetical protein
MSESEGFDIEQHIEVEIRDGYARTRGLKEKFEARELSMKLEPLHLTPAAVHLLNEAACRQALGHRFDEKSLFRYRSGAHLCQFLFRPGPLDTLEMVDLTLHDGAVSPGHDARACLTYFAQGSPHWDLGFGWPPRSTLADGIPEIVPGVSLKADVLDALGKPHKGDNRWLFGSPQIPVRVEVEWGDQEVVMSVSSNCLRSQGLELSEGAQLDDLEALKKADLQRTFVAPPDQTLVRIEEVRVLEHPTRAGSSLVLVSEYDSQESHKHSTCTWHQGAPEAILEELRPSFGQKLMTGFSPYTVRHGELSVAAQRLRVYMESSVRLVRQMTIAFGKLDWANEALDGYSLIVGAYLMNDGVPPQSVLREIGLPAGLYDEAFRQLQHYVESTQTRVAFDKQAEDAGVSFVYLAAFQWLLYNLTDGELEPEEQRLAIDLAQVFHPFAASLRELK